jgi:hypothetical protein
MDGRDRRTMQASVSTAPQGARKAGAEMPVLIALVVGWGALSLLGLVGVAAVCRSGHVEDVARGFAGPGTDAYPSVELPAPTPAGDDRQVTPR